MIRTYDIDQRFARNNSSTEAFDDFLDRVLDEFDALDVEADYLADLSTLSATWTVSVPAADNMVGMVSALTALRTALHAAQCATADWTTLDDIRAEAERPSDADNGHFATA
ncbi:MAG: hypothetical protein ACTH1D_01790 [Mycobacteriaceae bacterium]|uniref:hypothetical protein n=1 Tax=Corynebacterium variabile TaxID=1727 RepID=UPI003FB776B7